MVAITTLGCKVNQYESASFASAFARRGALIVPFSQPADIYVINTCAVTMKAGAQSRQTIRRALKKKSGARVVVDRLESPVLRRLIAGARGVERVIVL
ncbi:MAG: tRNA (N(6)-L-threonylcarbamoyladenosine(37)-C(2))-methylthiotransferase MtaB, partial [Deltaproteobacteria bacterium]|nr:tRNA (N(6)-L-threonylcarbamoyladenosine(37)-C(2))-methylthiotransferase MtaB [Deltaproteobacteria bacterium]